MKKFTGFEKGMGIGGWLTNYKRFNVLPQEKRLDITVGDMEHFREYIQQSDIINIKKMGLDHIRLGFDQIVLEQAPFEYREEIFDIISQFVGWCKKAGLNIVLNMHKAVGNYCDIKEDVTLFDSKELQDRFIALWLEFEKRFADDNSIVFELLNEVRDIEPDLWNDLAERSVKEIRKLNQNRKIIIGTTCWNSCYTLKDLRLYDDPNIIYTFHIYEPFEFTHQRGVLQAKPLYYNRKLQYPCDDIERYRDYEKSWGNGNSYADYERIDIRCIRDLLQPAVDFVNEHPDKILWCGEFGTIRHADITSRENWMRDVITVLKENDMPYCVWNYLSTPNDGNRFSLVDDDTRKILSKKMLKIIRGNI